MSVKRLFLWYQQVNNEIAVVGVMMFFRSKHVRYFLLDTPHDSKKKYLFSGIGRVRFSITIYAVMLSDIFNDMSSDMLIK